MEIIRLESSHFEQFKNPIKSLMRDAMNCSFPKAMIEERSYEDKLSELRKYIMDGSAIVYLAINKADVLGWIWCHPIQRVNERRLHIASFAVSENSRNKGVGTLLMKEAECYAKENDYISLDLLVTKDNLSALSFYKKHNYETERYLLKKIIH